MEQAASSKRLNSRGALDFRLQHWLCAAARAVLHLHTALEVLVHRGLPRPSLTVVVQKQREHRLRRHSAFRQPSNLRPPAPHVCVVLPSSVADVALTWGAFVL